MLCDMTVQSICVTESQLRMWSCMAVTHGHGWEIHLPFICSVCMIVLFYSFTSPPVIAYTTSPAILLFLVDRSLHMCVYSQQYDHTYLEFGWVRELSGEGIETAVECVSGTCVAEMEIN